MDSDLLKVVLLKHTIDIQLMMGRLRLNPCENIMLIEANNYIMEKGDKERGGCRGCGVRVVDYFFLFFIPIKIRRTIYIFKSRGRVYIFVDIFGSTL